MDNAKKPWIIIASGATIETAFLPYRVLELAANYGIRISVALSPDAVEFVSPMVLNALTQYPVYHSNTQLDPQSGLPIHRAWMQADLLLIYPSSARIIAQCALGAVTCAVTRLFAFMPKDRIIVAPAIHPDMEKSLYDGHIATIKRIGCQVVGGNDYWASWREVENAIVERLHLSRIRMPATDVLIDKLYR